MANGITAKQTFQRRGYTPNFPSKPQGLPWRERYPLSGSLWLGARGTTRFFLKNPFGEALLTFFVLGFIITGIEGPPANIVMEICGKKATVSGRELKAKFSKEKKVFEVRGKNNATSCLVLSAPEEGYEVTEGHPSRTYTVKVDTRRSLTGGYGEKKVGVEVLERSLSEVRDDAKVVVPDYRMFEGIKQSMGWSEPLNKLRILMFRFCNMVAVVLIWQIIKKEKESYKKFGKFMLEIAKGMCTLAVWKSLLKEMGKMIVGFFKEIFIGIPKNVFRGIKTDRVIARAVKISLKWKNEEVDLYSIKNKEIRRIYEEARELSARINKLLKSPYSSKGIQELESLGNELELKLNEIKSVKV
ncbi:MAG: hypothetical protein ABIH99_02040 [Candidatus Micrarchaeota archaeon]